MNTSANISIHRHCDNVALAFEGHNKTIYITKDQASWLCDRLTEAVRDIRENGFSDSRFTTREYLPPTSRS